MKCCWPQISLLTNKNKMDGGVSSEVFSFLPIQKGMNRDDSSFLFCMFPYI